MGVTKKIMVGLLVLGAIASLLYGFGVFNSSRPPAMTMGMMAVIDRQTGKPIAQPTFAFSAPIKISSLRVYDADDYSRQGELATPLWAMAGNPTSMPVREFTYGQRIAKMKPEKAASAPMQLFRDRRYCMVLKSDRGTYEKPFIYAAKQEPETSAP